MSSKMQLTSCSRAEERKVQGRFFCLFLIGTLHATTDPWELVPEGGRLAFYSPAQNNFFQNCFLFFFFAFEGYRGGGGGNPRALLYRATTNPIRSRYQMNPIPLELRGFATFMLIFPTLLHGCCNCVCRILFATWLTGPQAVVYSKIATHVLAAAAYKGHLS